MQRLFEKAKELYPTWDPTKDILTVENEKLEQFFEVLSEIYPDRNWIALTDDSINMHIAESGDIDFRNKIKTVIVGNEFCPSVLRTRIYNITFGHLFFYPNEVLPASGSYFMPQICPSQVLSMKRSIMQVFDVEELVDLKYGCPCIISDDQVVDDVVSLNKDDWKKMVKDKYFSEIDTMIDATLDSIYEMSPYPPQPTIEMLGRVMIRLHEDDFSNSYHPIYKYYSNETKIKAENEIV